MMLTISSCTFFSVCICLKKLIYFNWRIIMILWWYLPYMGINQPWVHMCPSIPNPSSISLPIPSLWVVPEPRLWIPSFMHGTCTGHLFYIHVSMLFCQIIPTSPSPTESKSLFFTSLSLLLPCIWDRHYYLSKSIYILSI